MFKLRLGVALLVLLPVVAHAQSGPPLKQRYLLDSQGNKVGLLVDNEELRATVQYELASGDSVRLDATPWALGSRPVVELYFIGSTDCTGPEAFTLVGRGQDLTTLFHLAKRQATVLNVTSPASNTTQLSSRLYVTDPFPMAMPAPADPSTSIYTRFAFPQPAPSFGECRAVLNDLSGQQVLRYTFVEDLAAKFTPPFWVP